MPVLDLENAVMRRDAVIKFTRTLMVEGRDYGKVPGTGDKPTLLKPGAEKLASLFGLTPDFDPIETVLDWTGDGHGGEPFFFIRYRCTLRRGDMAVGQGVGSCNSWEKKYRYRKGERTCPNCGQPAIIKGKAEYGGGWLCFAKKGGCGHKYQDGDQAIESQSAGQVKNPDAADVVNTIDKMAQKRALVAAVLIAVNASEMYTQDVEDYSDIVDGDWTPAPAAQQATRQQPASARHAQPATNGNGGNAPAQDLGPLAADEQAISESNGDFANVAAACLGADAMTIKRRMATLKLPAPRTGPQRIDAYRALKADLGHADDLMAVAEQPALVTVDDRRPGAEYQE
jgi:hypothetical protein